MIKVTFKTNRGNFTEEYDYFNFEVGNKVFTQSPFYKRRGTYEVIKIVRERTEIN